MEINTNKLKQSMQSLQDSFGNEDKFLEQQLRLNAYSDKDVEAIFNYLGSKLLDPEYTAKIGVAFENLLLLILTSVIRNEDSAEDFDLYQRKCVALSVLMRSSADVLRFSTKYFQNKPPPFVVNNKDETPNKKCKYESQVSDEQLVKCCFNLLATETAFFRDLWDWSSFVVNYLHRGSHLQQIYCNHAVALVSNMAPRQLKDLNHNIPEEVLLKFDNEVAASLGFYKVSQVGRNESVDETTVNLNFSSHVVTNVEGVLLPIFNYDNSKFYEKTDGNYDKIVKVDSTKVNLRSIALGISSGKAVCLSGPVGCGKTTLVEFMARKTGRIFPKQLEIQNFESAKENVNMNGNKIKHTKEKKNQGKRCNKVLQDEDDFKNAATSFDNRNGFLRIQLGDQTDSKMLLGQYRCTDVPGEFIWLPGVLTQAVMNGYWLLLEDLDCATQDTFTILSNLLENNFLSVPGFRDCVKIEPGFQLFVTVRTNNSTNNSQKSLYSLLEKYLYTINILPLSRNELCNVVATNYVKLKTVANRIVDVFLTFSSGNHTSADNLRNQETGDKADNAEKYLELPFERVSVSNLPNSGRLVSTRDLMKLCHRSNPMFSVTSTECAYFVFQNAVDVFCSYLPHGPEKTQLITSIGAKLGIIQSRCEFFSKEYKPDVQVDIERIKVGRAELFTKEDELIAKDCDNNTSQPAKKMKLEQIQEKNLLSEKKQKSTTFSFTRMTSCLLERIAVCVSQSEPILLVGETGVGKTSSVQYLAEKTRHKLVVVNMNNQSDVSDLVGGFKPVDLSYVIAPLRTEFERLFRKTYNQTKNENFLNKLSISYNSGSFSILLNVMLMIVDAVFKRARENTLKYKEDIPKWKELQVKLMKLNAQLTKSINISFAFIPGSLVNCIKNGDWVLLDEINLASAETLECLSTILEPDGSVVLLEKGDFTPVKRHPDFRIFACMNPNTDIGKKDLPVGIRNRFTEFFVDELTTESDLILLVSDYLNNTGIEKKRVTNIVKLYKKLKSLSKLDLNDGLGNRPVFSLRTLCRALRICAKNLCGSIERNLYESFCLSFLTQLDPASHALVLDLIKAAMLSNVKAVLSQGIPKPGEDYLNFEGYWIQKGPKEALDCNDYILTDSVKENLKDLARIISIGKLPILLQGPTSAGKTSLIEYVGKRSGNHCLRINNHEHTDLQEYIGTYTSDESGKLSFKEGVLVQAMRNGYWIILDELNLASTDILEALNRVLDDNRELFIPETQTLVKSHPNFMLFATQNPPGLYGGRKTLSRAFKNRFIELHFSEIPRNELEIILEKRCLIPQSYSKKMVKCMWELQMNRKSTSAKNVFTLRDLFRWGNRYTFADKKLLDNNLYDWNQHLIEEGYLVLSAKVRSEIEIEVIEEALHKNFRKRINLDHLFGHDENISPVTSGIIESINNYRNRTDIVWTRNMTRMAVLTAKALQFDEPVLLVGPTGCGKTTVCQILASIKDTTLRILNCHMHTEGADFLGGLRPCRESEENCENSKTGRKLFEWADGPLVISMQEGSYFMADEISLAEDSVLERLNCILEPERTVLLAEKGGVSTSSDRSDDVSSLSKEFVVKGNKGFQFLATMNPGGDFGKKELSPALRNRFTEIWCTPSDTKEDLVRIAANCLLTKWEHVSPEKINAIATFLVEVVFFIRDTVDKFKFSIRDILAWANFLLHNKSIHFAAGAIFGLETIFLDSLEMLPHESFEKLEIMRNKILTYAMEKVQIVVSEKFDHENLNKERGMTIEVTSDRFGIKPFYIPTNKQTEEKQEIFLFDAPTTKKNLFRLLAALSLNKAVLLEGPPGVGKTSIVESLAHAIGFKIVRINLCEHTDLADLFGTDLPAEDKALDSEKKENSTVGSFVWRDGPLLSALKSENTWILLDELNLAPQSVLEGLNAILDHRGEVFIPELNKTFVLGKQTRIFAAQNPLRQGGGRKGLPQSFLNRFTKVYLRKLSTEDLLFVVNGRYANYFASIKQYFSGYLKNVASTEGDSINLFDVLKKQNALTETVIGSPDVTVQFNLAERMVKFSEILDNGISQLEFGYKGGPFEINLRDILRWCDLLVNPKTGFVMQQKTCNIGNLSTLFTNFLQILFERMKLIYYQRMRSEQDKRYILNAFSTIFDCNAEELNVQSEDISLYWTDSKIYLNDIVLDRDSEEVTLKSLRPVKNHNKCPLILSSQREILKNLTECVHMDKPVLICGPTDSGKTKLIDILCTVSNQICNSDTIDDSVTGSFQQIDLNRHLEDVSQNLEAIMIQHVQTLILEAKSNKDALTVVAVLIQAWNSYSNLTKQRSDLQESTAMSDELVLFKNRIQKLNTILDKLNEIIENAEIKVELARLQKILEALRNLVQSAESLNTGGNFEWVDSMIVKSLKIGQYICLEHVNLCSSAVLDRLNPVFEPNGNLLISEKGVSLNDEAEIVEKHKNFRAFLTVDPKNGELSRAMRNRCVEISLVKDSYTEDDLKLIIYGNGISNVNLINTILKIHYRIRTVTELNNFNISHLTQFAFLVSGYKRIGYSDEKAVYGSAMEVYVYSSNTDLMGYGLEFYQNKLREIVVEESTGISIGHCSSDLRNVLVTCNNMNSISMIKLQSEPLAIMLNTFQSSKLCKVALSNLFSDFKNVNFENSVFTIKLYLYIIYESSSFSDVVLRHSYVTELLSNAIDFDESERKQLIQLNDHLFKTVKEYQNSFKNISNDLPWNTMLLPRIRDYANIFDAGTPAGLPLSALMLCKLLVEDLPSEKVAKLNQITALAYSQAISSKTITDSTNNALLQNLHSFLINMKGAVQFAVSESSLGLDDYANVINSYMWISRMTEVAKGRLFIDKAVSPDLLDKLLLHFKWVDKNLLKLLDKLNPDYKQLHVAFDSSVQKIINYSLSVKHPLNLMRKMYFKEMTNFDPYYSDDQIKRYELMKRYQELVKLLPHYGSFDGRQIMQKITAALCDDSKKLKANILSGKAELFKYIEKVTVTGNDEVIPESLRKSLDDFVRGIPDNSVPTDIDYTDLEKSFEELQSHFHDEGDFKSVPSHIEVEMLPIREYYTLKSIGRLFAKGSSNLNEFYFEGIHSLNCSLHQLLQIASSSQFSDFKELWTQILEHIETCKDSTEFEELLKFLSSYYRNFSTFARVVQTELQNYQMSSLAVRNDVCWNINDEESIVSSELTHQGPVLTSIVLKLLFQKDGSLRPIALKSLNEWRNSLSEIRQLVWNNSGLLTKEYDTLQLNFETSLSVSKKLIHEVEYVQALCHNIENENFTDYNENFQKLLNKLKSNRSLAIQCSETRHKSLQMRETMYRTALMNTLIGTIELCLLTFTPLIDPVEKNRLKHKYITEDITCLTTLTTVYDFMKIVMHYKGFGAEMYSEFTKKISVLLEKREKCSQKVALRPVNCIYSSLVQDISHFLNTNCDPKSLFELISTVEESWEDGCDFKPTTDESKLMKMAEVSKRIELWISNSQKFLHHTLKKYNSYYKDFVQPIECSIVMTRFGFEGLKAALEQINKSIVLNSKGIFVNINEDGKLSDVLENIIGFPSVKPIEIFNSTSSSKEVFQNRSSIFSVLDKVEGSEYLYFRLLKSKVLELKNRITISAEINETTFDEFDYALNICNQIWQEEEERRKLRKAEEESLYLTKTRCATEDEDVVEMREVQENFPTYVHEDFGDFVVEDTLEKVVKMGGDASKDSAKVKNIISDDDFKFLAEHFVHIMTNYTKLYYYTPNTLKSKENHIDFVTPFRERMRVFVKMFSKYKPALNDWVDQSIYNTFGFAVGLQQDMLKEVTINNNSKSHNFYKDSNIPEILSCTGVLDKIESKAAEQLALYPEHATLIDILAVVERIRSLPSTSSVVRFNTGFQILRQKVAQWNEVAHKNNHMKELEFEVAEYVTRWTKLELQFWRNCLTQSLEKVESNAYKYWFFIYNLFNEYLQEHGIDASFTDMRETEKRFGEGEILDNKKTIQIDGLQITGILRQFMEASTYGDFNIRLNLLHAFELYLHNIPTGDDEKKTFLIAILRNLQIYFEQFSQEIEDTRKSMRTPIEKKLKEFVKIESYNKDLSYFSMKNNVARVHRNLNKFLKEYEKQLKTKITPVFQPKDATVKDYNFEKDKGKNLRHEPKIKYYMIDVKNFIAPQKLKEKFAVESCSQPDDELVLLNKVDKLFMTSRNVVKEAISNAMYPRLIYSLDLLLCDQIESCDYLRGLEVDRTLEKPKQKLHAKQILQQKRKALSDLFKTLTNLGLSYKSGLMELSLETLFEDYTLQPFCIKTMLSKGKKIDQNIICLSENLDIYYAKCVFKLKLLQNLMLTPLSELGPPNIDRIKGFAVDMFILMQNQRRLMSDSVKNVYDLRSSILNIRNLSDLVCDNATTEEHLNFGVLRERFEILKDSFSKVRLIFEQFGLILKCIPEEISQDLCVLVEEKTRIVKSHEKYDQICERCQQILEKAKSAIRDISNTDTEFLNLNKIQQLEEIKKNMIVEIENVRCYFKVDGGDFLPVAKSLNDAVDFLKDQELRSLKLSEENSPTIENIDTELENIVHIILLSKQKLFKKYPKAEHTKEAKNSPNKEKSDDDEINGIQENHLKVKVYQELMADWEILNLPAIIKKITNILLTIKHTESIDNKTKCIRKIVSVLPILEQFGLFADYYIFQQLGAHKVSVKMLSVMLTVFVELSSKGFCVPQDLMQDEEGESNQNDDKNGEGFGLEDGTGEKDASDKIESEDQLDDAKRPEDRNNEEKKDENCKEEKGIDMSDDFDGQMQDVEKPEDEDDSGQSEDEDDLDKEMGETEQGAEKLDDQIWGSDEEEEEQQDNEDEMNEEEDGKGSKDDGEQHNNLDSKNEAQKGQEEEEQDGLDATDDQKDKKQKEKDIDNMQEPEVDEDQVNAYHNELEEPPEAEEMDLGDMNVDDEKDADDNKNEGENPFDIDTMKENMQIGEDEEPEGEEGDEETDEKDKENDNGSESEEEPEAGTKRDEENADEKDGNEEDNQKVDEEEAETQTRGDLEEEEKNSDENADDKKETKEEKPEDFEESKDKASKEENVQSVPETDNKGSNDQIQQMEEDNDVKQEQEMDAQDTGEEKDGVGQAENDTSDKGHQGIADTKETKSNEDKKNEKQTQEKRKQGRTDEERTLGDAEKNKMKELKTIDKLKEPKDNDNGENEEDTEIEAEEHQHVKDAKNNDKTTLDNATEEQSKKIQHLEDEKEEDENAGDEETNDDLMEVDEEIGSEENPQEVPEIKSEKTDQKSDKPSKNDKTKEKCEANETMEIDGEIVATMTVPRNDDTTAHCIKEILLDTSASEELTTAETLELRKLYQNQFLSGKNILPQHDDYESWQSISHKMLPNARELCEQLRLILEPTKCTRLKGDYRTGRRINMKKIIPYIASQFRKDKIWLRRTKPAQRDYKITIAIDDSKSMHHNNSKTLTLQAISLVSQALTLLESGKLSIVSFGEAPQIILNHTEQFDGPKLVNSLNFSQDKTNIAELLNFTRTVNTEEGSLGSDNGLFENLLLILSDGRNIYSEGKLKVRNAIKLARLQRMFLVYIIIDNPENKNSILDIQTMEVLPDNKISIKSYLDDFPFPYYVIVRDLGQLPIVLSEAMRQWFELVNSEQ